MNASDPEYAGTESKDFAHEATSDKFNTCLRYTHWRKGVQVLRIAASVRATPVLPFVLQRSAHNYTTLHSDTQAPRGGLLLRLEAGEQQKPANCFADPIVNVTPLPQQHLDTMKTLMLAAALAVSASSAMATDVGVSVTIGQPGFYGHIDIGDFPRPHLIYAEPRIIVRGPTVAPPIYMHVPPGHAKNWRKHCGRYDACGRPVYFVQDSWYNTVYVPRYQERERSRGGPSSHGDRRGDRHDHDDDRRGGKPDKGSHGKGQGNGRGRD